MQTSLAPYGDASDAKSNFLVTNPDGSRCLAIPANSPLLRENGASDAGSVLHLHLDRLAFLRDSLSASDEAVRTAAVASFEALYISPVRFAQRRALCIVVADSFIILLDYALLRTTRNSGVDEMPGPIDGASVAILVQVAAAALLGVIGILRFPLIFTFYLFVLMISIFFNVRLVVAFPWFVYIVIFVRIVTLLSGVHYRFVSRRLNRIQTQFRLSQSARFAQRESLAAEIEALISSARLLMHRAGAYPLLTSSLELVTAAQTAGDMVQSLDLMLAADSLVLAMPQFVQGIPRDGDDGGAAWRVVRRQPAIVAPAATATAPSPENDMSALQSMQVRHQAGTYRVLHPMRLGSRTPAPVHIPRQHGATGRGRFESRQQRGRAGVAVAGVLRSAQLNASRADAPQLSRGIGNRLLISMSAPRLTTVSPAITRDPRRLGGMSRNYSDLVGSMAPPAPQDALPTTHRAELDGIGQLQLHVVPRAHGSPDVPMLPQQRELLLALLEEAGHGVEPAGAPLSADTNVELSSQEQAYFARRRGASRPHAALRATSTRGSASQLETDPHIVITMPSLQQNGSPVVLLQPSSNQERGEE